MKVSNVIKGGVYRLPKQDDPSYYSYYLVIGGTTGDRICSNDIYQRVNCMSMAKKRRNKYSVPINIHGDTSYIDCSTIYSYTRDEVSLDRFIGCLSDNPFSTTQEFIEMLYGVYTYIMGMSNADIDGMLDEYNMYYEDAYDDIEEAPIHHNNHVKTSSNIPIKPRQGLSVPLGNVVDIPQPASATVEDEQRMYANTSAVLIEDTDEVITHKKTKRVAAVTRTQFGESDCIEDDLHQLILLFKDEYRSSDGINPNGYKDLADLWKLCKSNNRLDELAFVLQYKNPKTLYQTMLNIKKKYLASNS